jgi:uncharacterized protein YuzE
MAVQVTYDTISDVYTIELSPRPIARTVEFDGVHLVDLDEDGSVVSIEVLDPDRARLSDVANEFGLTDQLSEIEVKVSGEVPPLTRPAALYASYMFTAATHFHPGALVYAKAVSSGQSRPAAPAHELSSSHLTKR